MCQPAASHTGKGAGAALKEVPVRHELTLPPPPPPAAGVPKLMPNPPASTRIMPPSVVRPAGPVAELPERRERTPVPPPPVSSVTTVTPAPTQSQPGVAEVLPPRYFPQKWPKNMSLAEAKRKVLPLLTSFLNRVGEEDARSSTFKGGADAWHDSVLEALSSMIAVSKPSALNNTPAAQKVRMKQIRTRLITVGLLDAFDDAAPPFLIAMK